MNLITFLTSRGFAIALLSGSIILLIIRTRNPEFHSPIFLILPALVLLSLILCTLKRAIKSEGGMRFWGSIIFHGGLMIWVTAMFISPMVRFSARLSALEGVSVGLEDRDFVEVFERPIFGETSPYISLRLNRYEAKYKDGIFPVDHSAYMNVNYIKGDEYKNEDVRIRINEPLKINGYQFLLEYGGFTPSFRLKNKDGRVIFERYIILSNDTSLEDSFEIKDKGLRIFTRFFPDMYREGGKVGTRSRIPGNTAFGIRIEDEKRPFEIYSGVLKEGDKVEVDGMPFEFNDLKPFVSIQVVNDPVYYQIFIGWGVGLIGLVMRYLPLRVDYEKY